MRAVIAMSGGVDSSIAALLMKKDGFDCMGATMRLFCKENLSENDFQKCGNSKDIEDAKAVADTLGIPYHVIDYSSDFDQKVIRNFVETYENGGTPNPCIECNRYLKFGGLLDWGINNGNDVIATGHYARVEFDEETKKYKLRKAKDLNKDQSYVLFSLTQEQLSHVRFPLGDLSKDEVRKLAEDNNFVNADKQDSQDICFVPDGDYAKFLEEYTGHTYPNGEFVDNAGNVLGEHKGIIRYTIGQRKGLGIASTAPLFVTKIDPQNNKVILSHGDGLFKKKVYLDNINLIDGEKLTEPIRVSAKIRYRHKEQPATLIQLDDDSLLLEFDEPQRAPTFGQSAVIYDGEYCLGGGRIVKAED